MSNICILDYGLGNIKSLYNALTRLGYKIDFFSTNEKKNYDIIFIPGVGSYNKASQILNKEKYLNFINKKNKNAKIFGICLGMQIFSTIGEENGTSRGLNFIEGQTLPLNKNLILPFVGYFRTKFNMNKNLIFLNKFDEEKFYFVHSFHFQPKNYDHVLAITEHQDIEYCAAVMNNRYIGTQFHPEKSGEIGLEFLKEIINNFK